MLQIWPQTLLSLTWCAVLLSNFGARLHNTLGKDLLLMYCLIAWKNLAAFHQMGYLISKEKYWDWKHVMLCLCEWHDSQHSIPNYKTQFWNPSIIKKVIYIWHFRISWNGTSSNSLMLCPNVSTTPITAMGCRQCLPLSVVQLKGKHCRKPHCRNGVVDTFGLYNQ